MTAKAARDQAMRPEHSAFVSLRSRPYRILWISGLFIFLSVMVQGLARAWLARELTGSNAGLGGVLLAFGLLSLVFSPFGGVAADRLPKRLILVVSQLVLVASAVGLAIAVVFEFVEYWMLLASSGIQAGAFSFYGPTRMAFTAELVEPPQLSNAVSLGQMSAEGMRVIGPSVAGVLLAAGPFGVKAVFVATATVFVIALVVSFWLPKGRPPTRGRIQSPVAELREGLAYVRAHRHLRLLVTATLGVVMIGFPYLAFLPSVAVDLFGKGAGAYGLMTAIGSAGAVVAALLTARRARADLWRRLVIFGIGFGAGLILLGLSPIFLVALVALPIIGAGSLVFQTSNQSLLLMMSDFEYHGRLQGIVMLGFSGFGIAALPLGILADAIGLRPTLVMMGIASTAIVATVAALGAEDRALLSARDLG